MTMTFSVLLALIFLLEFGAGISAYMLRANVCTHAQNSIWKRYTFDKNAFDAQLINKKLLQTGFKFLYELEENIKEMVFKWSKKDLIDDLEYVKDGENLFIDDRGVISNHELTEPINLIGMIKSKKGTIRANHYHPSLGWIVG